MHPEKDILKMLTANLTKICEKRRNVHLQLNINNFPRLF